MYKKRLNRDSDSRKKSRKQGWQVEKWHKQIMYPVYEIEKIRNRCSSGEQKQAAVEGNIK